MSRADLAGTRPAQAAIVAPGLAITASANDGQQIPSRYSLTHLPTGLAIDRPRCGLHIQEAATTAVDSGIDWTGPKDTVTAAAEQAGLRTALGALRCKPWCAGDGPKPDGWRARCTTCGWETDDHNDVPLTAGDDARRVGDDHECDPYVELQPPNTSGWHDPDRVGDGDGDTILGFGRPASDVAQR